MHSVTELQRRPSPGGRPQPLAFYDGKLYVGSWDTDHVYSVDPKTWEVVEEIAAPGKPFGMTVFGDGLLVVVAIGDDDDRFLVNFIPGRGFDTSSQKECPDFTGSHLAADDGVLYLCQQTNQRILVLDADAKPHREIALPTRCAGLGFGSDGESFIISGDAEFENLALARFDLRANEPVVEPIASMSAEARALAFDGAAWWTSYRDVNEIVSFTAG